MRKLAKFIIIISILLLIAGGALTAYAFARNEFVNSRGKEVINKYEFENEIENIDIDVQLTNLTINYVEGNKCVIDCVEKEDVKNEAKIENNTLIIKQNDTRKWYQKFFFNFGFELKVIVSLPKNTYNNLKIKSETGSINVGKNLTFTDATINSSTGGIKFYSNVNNNLVIGSSTGGIGIENININNANITSSTGGVIISKVNALGDITYKGSTGGIKFVDSTMNSVKVNLSTGSTSFVNTIANSRIDVDSSTGSVKFDRADAHDLKIHTSTGSVSGTLLTPKIFRAKSSTGTPHTDDTTTGGICEVETSTGGINLTVINK